MRATTCERCDGWGCRWCRGAVRARVPLLAKVGISVLYAAMLLLVAGMIGALLSLPA